jgi:ATP-binding cassette subfamily B protein
MTGVGTMLVFGGITYVLWLGAHAVLGHVMTWGQLSQFFVYAAIVGTSAAALTEMWGEVQRAAGAMERLSELLVAQPAIAAPALPLALPARVRGDIAFEHVNFRYPSRPDILALNDYTLSVRSGETVAVVGPSGAGKSTTFQLLLRFYDPESGRITIDGSDLRRLRPEELRRQIGFVPQDTVLFGASARDNIGYGRPGASDAQIEAAARAAAADQFLRELPAGYDTFLGERGTRLSGGQRQRIAIARVLLKNAPILVLDEATSALDSEVEAAIQENFQTLMEGKTVIAIAHRLSTIAAMDRLIVLENGAIAEMGTHQELLARGGIYASLWRHQSGGFLEASAA